jgi:hypothetical protein
MTVRRLLGEFTRTGALLDLGLGVLALPSSGWVAADDRPRGARAEPHAPVHDGTASALLW